MVVICGSIFAVNELQRRTDAVSFEEYASVRELRNAGMSIAIVTGEALEHGAAAAADVDAAEREATEAVDAVNEREDEAEEAELIDQQIAAIGAMSKLADEAVRGGTGARLESRRDELLNGFIKASDELVAEVTAEREVGQSSAARRPVILVAVLSLFFALMHVLLVELPARRERRRTAAQWEFGEAIQVARSEEEAYHVLSVHVSRAAGARQVTVLNRNNSADRLEPVTPVETGSSVAESLEGAKPDSCLAIRLARIHHGVAEGEALLSCDVCGASPGQTTCVPSLVGGEVVGSVLVNHRRPLERQAQARIQQSVAEAAPVIANLRNLAVAEIRAATDGLTGLPNQRAVHDTIKRAAALAGRTASPLCLVLFDLDHFKGINDTYGHGKGDEVLAAVGAAATAAVRASDFVGRLGGEEFAVLLPATDRQGGLDAGEKLRAAIASINVPGIDRSITASFGVAVMPDDAGEPNHLLREADRALYSAKTAGRNRVETVQTVDPAALPAL